MKGKFLHIVFLSFFCLFIVSNGQLKAQDTGWLDPATFAEFDQGGGVDGGAWTIGATPADPSAQDDGYARYDYASKNKVSKYIVITGFSAAIPAGQQIDGVEVRIDFHATGAESPAALEENIYLVKGGTVQTGTTDKGTGAQLPAADGDTYKTFGTAADLWGNTLAESDVEAAGFGVAFTIKSEGSNPPAAYIAFIDHVQIKVTYSPAPTLYSCASGDWSTAANWDFTAGCTSTGDGPPVAGQFAVIQSGHRIDVDGASACANLVINSGGILDFNATNNDLTISAGLQVDAGGDIEGTNTGAVLEIEGGGLVLNADISIESGGGAASVFKANIMTGAGQSISGTGTLNTLDIDANATNTGTITVTNTLTGGATLTQGAGATMTVSGDVFTLNAIDATTNANTFVFNTTIAGGALDFTNNSNDLDSYHHLTIGGTRTYSHKKDLIINGNLSLTGTLDQSALNRDINIKGNWTNSGTFTASTTRTVTFDGTAAGQNITSGGSNFTAVTISNANNVTLLDATTATGTFTFTSGKLVCGAFNMILANATVAVGDPIAGESSATYFVTNSTGHLRINNIGTGGRSGAVVFPVGISTTEYTPVTVNNDASDGREDFSVHVCDNIRDNGLCSGGALIATNAIDKTYTIDKQAGTSAALSTTVTLQWNAADELGGHNGASCYISKYGTGIGGAGWYPEQVAGPEDGANFRTVTGISSFSPFGTGSGGTLPVSLIDFTALNINNEKVELQWSTASETNNSHFTLERSEDAKNFTKVAQVSGLGNTTHVTNYSYLDENPPKVELLYYRLNQIDYDGSTTKSKLISVSIDIPKLEIQKIFPNPAAGAVYVALYSPEQTNIELNIYSQTGQIVNTQQLDLVKGDNLIQMNIENLNAGMFYLNFNSDSKFPTFKAERFMIK